MDQGKGLPGGCRWGRGVEGAMKDPQTSDLAWILTDTQL